MISRSAIQRSCVILGLIAIALCRRLALLNDPVALPCVCSRSQDLAERIHVGAREGPPERLGDRRVKGLRDGRGVAELRDPRVAPLQARERAGRRHLVQAHDPRGVLGEPL